MTQQLEPTHRITASGLVVQPAPAPRRSGRVVAAVAAVVAVLVVAVVVAGVVTGALRLPTATGPATPAAPAVVDPSPGRAQLLRAYGELSAAAQTFSDDLAAHRGDTVAQQRDCAVHRAAVLRFRAAVVDTPFAPDDARRVGAELLPAADRVVADLDTMMTTPSTRTLVDTAGAFDRHGAELDTVVRSILAG